MSGACLSRTMADYPRMFGEAPDLRMPGDDRDGFATHDTRDDYAPDEGSGERHRMAAAEDRDAVVCLRERRTCHPHTPRTNW
jgi:hypothetical protein